MQSKSSIASRYDEVWRAAAPYMPARKNYIHIPLSFRFAGQLLDAFPDADTDIVHLAILLHDIGWQNVDAATMEHCFSAKFTTNARVLHEKEGARLAREILQRIGWPETVIAAVCEIIDGHDTRAESVSLNDRIVRDADKLWRFTVTGVAVVADWLKMTPHQYVDWLEQLIASLETETGREMATAELSLTRSVLMLHLI